MQVYIEVSKNHNIPIEEVIRGKFKPEIKLLIMYYNNKLRMEEKEAKKIEKQIKKNNGGEHLKWQEKT